jgi:hypothetical protein
MSCGGLEVWRCLLAIAWILGIVGSCMRHELASGLPCEHADQGQEGIIDTLPIGLCRGAAVRWSARLGSGTLAINVVNSGTVVCRGRRH